MNDIADHNPDDLLTEYGMATTAYLLMVMSIDSLERRNKQLEAENVKLRKQYEAVINDYRSEVAKLRELCADMWKAIKTHKRINFAQLLQFGERIRKLRIEVD